MGVAPVVSTELVSPRTASSTHPAAGLEPLGWLQVIHMRISIFIQEILSNLVSGINEGFGIG